MKLSKIIYIIIGVIILIVLSGLLFKAVDSRKGFSKLKKEDLISTDLDSFNVERAYLVDTSGAELYAMARRAFSAGQFVFAIEASLPEAVKDQKIEAWLVNDKGEKIMACRMQKESQNYIGDFQSDNDLRQYSKVEVTMENEKNEIVKILEGQFDGESKY